MRLQVSLFALIFLCGAAVGFVQQKPSVPSHTSSAPQSPAVQPAAPTGVRALDQEDAQALKSDLNRMRSLLQQMETNIAFVQNTQTPLKHQFELEIDMWRLQIDDMDRRVRSASAR
jgi:hypothetical protein